MLTNGQKLFIGAGAIALVLGLCRKEERLQMEREQVRAREIVSASALQVATGVTDEDMDIIASLIRRYMAHEITDLELQKEIKKHLGDRYKQFSDYASTVGMSKTEVHSKE